MFAIVEVFRQDSIRAMEIVESNTYEGVFVPVVRISNPLGDFLYNKLLQLCGYEYLQNVTITEPYSTDSRFYGPVYNVLLLLQTFVHLHQDAPAHYTELQKARIAIEETENHCKLAISSWYV